MHGKDAEKIENASKWEFNLKLFKNYLNIIPEQGCWVQRQ